MKHIKLYENYIVESILSKSDIYNKYYSNIDSTIFNKIIESDPTSINDKVGKYSKWLLNLYIKKSLKIEDLYKATEYLKTFDMFKHKLLLKDINKFKSLQELYKIVEPYIERDDNLFSSDIERKLIGQFKEVFRNNIYRIIIPYTLEASKYFGRDTEWCTLYPNNFKNYTYNQRENIIDENCLYILYTENLNERLQFHFYERQFMDVDDMYIDIEDFLNNNKDIKDFFNKHFITDIYTKGPVDVIEELSKDYGLNILFIDEYISDYETKNPNWRDNDIDVIIFDVVYDENPMDGSYSFYLNFIVDEYDKINKFADMIRKIYKNKSIFVENEDEYVKIEIL